AKELLGIDFHETTADGEVTLLPVYCLGNCACSPSVRVGNEIFSHVDKFSFDTIIDGLGHQAVEVK
ncbi:MAG: NAD(P)H-dependent oxidoreductase subunit E, partial [Pseudohongiellaceae bacterium]